MGLKIEYKLEIGFAVCTFVIMLLVGFHVWDTMYDEIESYEGEIVEIGPPGVTNIVPVVILVVVSVFMIEVVLWLSKRGKTPLS